MATRFCKWWRIRLTSIKLVKKFVRLARGYIIHTYWNKNRKVSWALNIFEPINNCYSLLLCTHTTHNLIIPCQKPIRRKTWALSSCLVDLHMFRAWRPISLTICTYTQNILSAAVRHINGIKTFITGTRLQKYRKNNVIYVSFDGESLATTRAKHQIGLCIQHCKKNHNMYQLTGKVWQTTRAKHQIGRAFNIVKKFMIYATQFFFFHMALRDMIHYDHILSSEWR